MKVESFTGPVSATETNSFYEYVSTLKPDTDNVGNRWSYGPSGTAVRAIGLVYELNRDPRLLYQMTRFCDALLHARNDLATAPIGQHRIWTGRIDPVWPNNLSIDPIGTGGEQGDAVGNLAYCANLILHTSSMLDRVVPDGDELHYGSTYLDRAKTYLKQADASIDGHVLYGLLDLSLADHQYFSSDSPYKEGTPVPWNQQMMLNYAFMNLASAHHVLNDDPSRTARYHRIVADSLLWFFKAGSTKKTDRAGRPVYDWGYALPSTSGEDSTHAGMDIAGFVTLYASGDYGLGREQMKPFLNMLLDVLTLNNGKFAGRVDGSSGVGHAAETSEIRSGFLLLAAFSPTSYRKILTEAGLKEGGTTDRLDLFSRFLWVKSENYRLRGRSDL